MNLGLSSNFSSSSSSKREKKTMHERSVPYRQFLIFPFAFYRFIFFYILLWVSLHRQSIETLFYWLNEWNKQSDGDCNTNHLTAVINGVYAVDILRTMIGFLGAIPFEINYNWDEIESSWNQYSMIIEWLIKQKRRKTDSTMNKKNNTMLCGNEWVDTQQIIK